MGDYAELLQNSDIQNQFVLLKQEDQAAWNWRAQWISKAYKHQILPAGDWWSIWLMLAGRGAGKTRTAAEQIGWWAWTEPKSRILVAAPTSSDVRSTCFEGESGLMSVIPSCLIENYNRAFHELTLINGSLIKGIPASEPERFRGPQFGIAWCDELAAWDYLDDAWDQIMFSVRLGERTRIICTTTPKPKDLIVDLVSREGKDVVLTRASTYANLANLSPTFRAQILQYEGTRLGRQEIHAEIIDPEESGIVKRHMFRLWPHDKPLPKFEFIVQSYDCAYTDKTQNDPTACLVFGVFKPQDGPMSAMVIDAWQDKLQYPDLKPKVIEEYKVSYGEGKNGKRVDLILVEEKSSGISLIQDLQRAHLPVHAYNPGRADKMQRLNIVSNIIAAGRVWLIESSVNQGFVRDWAEGFVSQICAFPDTTNDDYVDACVDSETQIQMAVGTKAIKDVVVGDMVMTPNGPRRVTAVHDNGMREVWNVNGLLATAEHRVMTQYGWLRVDCLTQGVHNLFLYRRDGLWESVLKRLCLMVAGIGAIRTAAIRRIGNIFRALAQGFIGTFGLSITAPFRTGCTFITSMATPRTMTSQTLSAYQGLIIGGSILKSAVSATSLRGSWSIFPASGQRPRNGIDPQKESLGTRRTRNLLFRKLGGVRAFMRKSLLCARGAASRLYEKAADAFTAGLGVRRPSQNTVSVKQVINTRTMRHVFDLTVESDHCYYANGILVHNCTQALRYLRDAGWLNIDPPPREEDYDDYLDETKPRRINPYAA